MKNDGNMVRDVFGEVGRGSIFLEMDMLNLKSNYLCIVIILHIYCQLYFHRVCNHCSKSEHFIFISLVLVVEFYQI